MFLSGGALGDAFGGRLPDILDPPCSPDHRQAAHAIIPVGVVYRVLRSGFAQVVEQILCDAERTADPPRRDGLLFLAGTIHGLGPGYFTHLALDACTPQGPQLFGDLPCIV